MTDQTLAESGETAGQTIDGLTDLPTGQQQMLPPQRQHAADQLAQRLIDARPGFYRLKVARLLAARRLATEQQGGNQPQRAPPQTEPGGFGQDGADDQVSQGQCPCRIRVSHARSVPASV